MIHHRQLFIIRFDKRARYVDYLSREVSSNLGHSLRGFANWKYDVNDDVYHSRARSKWFSVRRIRGIDGGTRKGGNTRVCQNQRDAGLHQSQVRASYASASVEGRGEETRFGAHWCRRLIERAVATRASRSSNHAGRNGDAARVEQSSFPGYIHRFFNLCLRVLEIDREKITKFRHKVSVRTIMPDDIICYLLNKNRYIAGNFEREGRV